MRSQHLLLTLTLAAAPIGLLLGACSDDGTDGPVPGTTTTSSTTTGTGGSACSTRSGGSGGSTATGGGTGGTATGGSGGGCVGCSPCEAACHMIEHDCGFAIPCDQMPGGMLDCENNQPQADCIGECMINSDCAAIASLATANPDPTLAACIQACQT
jgi:hypothetical protein